MTSAERRIDVIVDNVTLHLTPERARVLMEQLQAALYVVPPRPTFVTAPQAPFPLFPWEIAKVTCTV